MPTNPAAPAKIVLTETLVLSFYQGWAVTHQGLNQEQLIKGFTDFYVVPTAVLKYLKEQLIPPKPKPPEKPPAPPPKPPETTPPKQPTVKPELVISRTPYPKWWKDSLNAKIDLTAPGSQILATVAGSLRLYVATIVITVTGAVAITFEFGNAGSSGPIYLGDTNQPMGMVIAMGNSPAPCGSGNLTISATDINGENPSVGGFATCFVEEVIKQKV